MALRTLRHNDTLGYVVRRFHVGGATKIQSHVFVTRTLVVLGILLIWFFFDHNDDLRLFRIYTCGVLVKKSKAQAFTALS